MNKKLRNILVAAVGLILVVAIILCATMCGTGGKKKPTSNNKVDQTTSSTQSQTESVDSGSEEIPDDSIGDIDEPGDDYGDEWDDSLIGGNEFDDQYDDVYEDFEDFGDFEDFEDDFDEFDDDIDFDLTEYTNPIQLYGTAVSGNNRTINIDLDKVIHEDFLGYGDHVFVQGLNKNLMDSIGYNESFFEFDMTRADTVRSNIARMWFQVEWIVTDTEPNPVRSDYKNNKDYQNYIKGIYDFDSDAMQSVYKFIERYEEIGTDIMFNFAWKQDVRIQTWFSVPCELPTSGAPYDAKAFAKAAVATLQNFKARGYKNVPYLAYYNEPANDKDFATVGDSASYWAVVAHYTDKALKDAGIRDEIAFFGCEINDLWRGHHAYMDKFVKAEQKYNAVDYYSCHHYYKTPHGDNNYQTTFEDMLYFSNEYKKRMMITEMSATLDECVHTCSYTPEECITKCTNQQAQYFYHRDWNDTYTSYIIASANVGVKGVLNWGFSSGYTGDKNAGWQGQQIYTATYIGTKKNILGNEFSDLVSKPFKEIHETSLLCNYIDSHSDVLMVDWTGDDIRASVFRNKDGEYTILVDTKGGEKPLDVTFALSRAINKTFYRFQYDRDQEVTTNFTIPACQEKISATNSFKDTLDAKEAMYIYTTKKPRKQVKVNEVFVKLRAGKTFDFNASFIDCPAGSSVNWTVSSATNKEGTIDSNGVYTAASDALRGDFVTVRATLDSDKKAYATALIEII